MDIWVLSLVHLDEVSCEKEKQKWIGVQLGPGFFEVKADCPPCAVETLDAHLRADRNDGVTHQEAYGVPLPDKPGVLLRVGEIDEARQRQIEDQVVPQLGGQVVNMAMYTNSIAQRIQEIRGIC